LPWRSVERYAIRVIKSFRHSGIERFFKTRSKAGIQPKHAAKLPVQLFALNRARSAQDTGETSHISGVHVAPKGRGARYMIK